MKYLITGVLLVTAVFGSKIKEFVLEKLEDSKEKREAKKKINEAVIKAFLKKNNWNGNKRRSKRLYKKLVVCLKKEC